MEKRHPHVTAAAAGSLHELFGAPVHVVTRQDLLDDGTLIDAGAIAREAGFRVPVALSREVWHDCIEWSAQDSARQCSQDREGRLWDVLFMAVNCAQRNQQALFEVLRVPRDGRSVRPSLVTLKLMLGADDAGSPCFTIFEPGQD